LNVSLPVLTRGAISSSSLRLSAGPLLCNYRHRSLVPRDTLSTGEVSSGCREDDFWSMPVSIANHNR